MSAWQTDAATVQESLGKLTGHATVREPDAIVYYHSAVAALERLCVWLERQDTALTGLMEIAEMAMPDSYFQTDSRVVAARSVVAGGGDET